MPGVLLGLGVGGFIDGIVLHQVLQWHHMRTGNGVLGERSAHTVSGLEANTLADGLFHLATLILTVVGVFVLSSRTRGSDGDWSRQELVGWMLVGWGAFNLVGGRRRTPDELVGEHQPLRRRPGRFDAVRHDLLRLVSTDVDVPAPENVSARGDDVDQANQTVASPGTNDT